MFGQLVNRLTIWGMRELNFSEMSDLQHLAENINIRTPTPAAIKAYREVTGKDWAESYREAIRKL
jgi:hypothetical protein